MTTVTPTITDLPRGARFYRADLHVHSFGGSHDVKDPLMTPEQIVAQAAEEALELIAVADHNEISSVAATLAAADSSRLLAIPAVELSTSQGHILCYAPTLDALQRFHAQLEFADRGTPNSRCRTAVLQCLDRLEEVGGFAILAHVDAAGGLEQVEPGGSPHKADIICHRALLGVELKNAASLISYGSSDPDAERKKVGRLRIKRLGLGEMQYLARVLNSDAHSLSALGRNANGDQRVTRFKMDVPSFEGLRLALEDADARVRLEDEIPKAVPSILGVRFSGGFLDTQAIHFSQNLNCIIGGRGTGKSTTFEAVRCLSAEPTSSEVVDSDIWPQNLELLWQDEAGQQHSLTRAFGGSIEHSDDPFGPTSFELDCFGQGEAARISTQVNTNPMALLNYLDRFIRVSEAIEAENQCRDELLQLQTKIEAAESKVESIPQFEKALRITRQQIAALKTAKAEEIITLQRQVEEERSVRAQIEARVSETSERVRQGATSIGSLLRDLTEPGDVSIGSAEFDSILSAADTFDSGAAQSSAALQDRFQSFQKAADAQITAWKVKETAALRKIEEKRKELEAQGLRLDMAYIKKLTRDEATHQTSLTNLKTWKPHLEQLRKDRLATLKRRWNAREHVATLRDAYARQASSVLDRELVNPKVSLKFMRDSYSPAATDLIITTMGWRTVQVSRAALLVEQLTIPALLKALDGNDPKPIMNLTTADGVKVFNKKDAIAILERLGEQHVKFALERCEVHELPKLVVTKRIDEGGSTRYVPRDFGKLSLGQQQSVLLALILCSSGSHPLIVDQPEDNLDGEFIYHTLVPVLRRAKERRQIIVVTHNANIAVLGDAELIVVLKSGAEKGMIVCRGSIDNESTRSEACKILEGAREAFQRRARTYGFRFAGT